jgi:hypothetical protein
MSSITMDKSCFINTTMQLFIPNTQTPFYVLSDVGVNALYIPNGGSLKRLRELIQLMAIFL